MVGGDPPNPSCPDKPAFSFRTSAGPPVSFKRCLSRGFGLPVPAFPRVYLLPGPSLALSNSQAQALARDPCLSRAVEWHFPRDGLMPGCVGMELKSLENLAQLEAGISRPIPQTPERMQQHIAALRLRTCCHCHPHRTRPWNSDHSFGSASSFPSGHPAALCPHLLLQVAQQLLSPQETFSNGWNHRLQSRSRSLWRSR